MNKVEHRCSCGKAVMANDNPDDRPKCWHSGKGKAMKPGTVQVVSRLSREALHSIEMGWR
jgi:hypothetical protein